MTLEDLDKADRSPIHFRSTTYTKNFSRSSEPIDEGYQPEAISHLAYGGGKRTLKFIRAFLFRFLLFTTCVNAR